MKKPDPEVGQIVKYDYLWLDEQASGRIEGTKDRPCAVVVARRSKQDGSFDVLLAPITHSPPKNPKQAISIPSEAQKSTGLDQEKSWLLTSEVNQAAWSDAGIIPARRGEWLYGKLPRGIAAKAVKDITEIRSAGKLQIVDRVKAELSRGIWNRSSGDDRGR